MKKIVFTGVDLISEFLVMDEEVQDSVLMILNAVQEKRRSIQPKRSSDSVAAKTCTPQKRKVFTRQPFLPEELKFIRDCLASGLSQGGTAREAKIKFNRRSIGAYALRVSEIAKERKNAN